MCNAVISSSHLYVFSYVNLTVGCLLIFYLLTLLTQVVPGSFRYSGPLSASLQNNIASSNTSTSKPPAELSDAGLQSKSKLESRNLPPKSSSSQMLVPDGRVPDASVASNESAEQLSKRDSLSEVEQQAGEVTMSTTGKSAHFIYTPFTR